MATGYVGCEPLLAPDGRSTAPGLPEVAANLSASRANSYGAYLSDTLSLGSQFKLVGGMRRDRLDGTIANVLLLLNPTVLPPEGAAALNVSVPVDG